MTGPIPTTTPTATATSGRCPTGMHFPGFRAYTQAEERDEECANEAARVDSVVVPIF